MRRILYLRLPYFHSAVQALLDPALAGRAVIVAAGSYQRGRVVGVSPEAAAAGAERGMPWRPARRRCPEAALVRYERAQYAPVVEQVGVLLARYTPWVERLNGAEDEFFANLGEGDPDAGAALAARLQDEVAVELRLAAVLGLASGKLAARSLVENDPVRPGQPTPIRLLPAGRSRRFLRGRPVTDLWDLKPEAQRRLELLGVRTLGQVAALPTRALIQPLGPAARWYQRLALGIDRRRVAPWRPAPVETAACFVEESEPDLALLHGYLEQLARQIAGTLLDAGRYGRSVSLLLQLPGGGRRFATRHLKEPTHLWPVIFTAASALLEQLTTTAFGGVTGEEWRGRSDPDLPHPPPRAAELLELRVGALETRSAIQLSIFGDEDRGPALRSAIARLQSRYGEGVIVTAGKYVDAGC